MVLKKILKVVKKVLKSSTFNLRITVYTLNVLLLSILGVIHYVYCLM